MERSQEIDLGIRIIKEGILLKRENVSMKYKLKIGTDSKFIDLTQIEHATRIYGCITCVRRTFLVKLYNLRCCPERSQLTQPKGFKI